MNHTLKYNDRIEMHSTTDPFLDNKTGTLIGIASIFPENNFWIVELDEPLVDRRAVVLTDACIRPAMEAA